MTTDEQMKEAPPGSLHRMVRLLDDCDAALTAASANVMNPDLAIACTQRARRCRQMIADLKQLNSDSTTQKRLTR